MPTNTELRLKQINEILNQDRYINQKVVNLLKKSVKKYDEDLVPIPAADNEVLGNVQMVLDKLNAVIYNKASLLETVPANIRRFYELGDYKAVVSTFGEINKVDEVISLYNAVVRALTEPSTMTASSKIAFQTKLQTLAQTIGIIYEKLERIILIYIKEFNITTRVRPGDQLSKEQASLFNFGRVIGKMLSTFCVYRIIKEQIEANKFHTLALDDFEHEVKRLVDKNPEVRTFLEKFKSEIDPRLNSTNLNKKFKASKPFKEQLKEAIAEFEDEHGRKATKKELQTLESRLKQELQESMKSGRINTENAYESELGRPMSSEERRLFYPFSDSGAAASSSSVIPAPAALTEGDAEGEAGEAEEELPPLEDVKEVQLNDYIDELSKQYFDKFKAANKSKEEFEEALERTSLEIKRVLPPLFDSETIEALKKKAKKIYKDFFF